MIKQYDQFTNTGGQFGPEKGVNLHRSHGGQFAPKKWGQFHRNFHFGPYSLSNSSGNGNYFLIKIGLSQLTNLITISKNPLVEIYPNPCGDFFSIRLIDNYFGIHKLEITNMLGVVVFQNVYSEAN